MGEFVVKIFSKNKELNFIESNVRSLLNFHEGNVPVPKIYQTYSGDFLYRIENNPTAYLIVMDYFDGKKFTEIEPTTGDIKKGSFLE